MDFGYPQFTEAKILSEFIKTDAHKMEVTVAVCFCGIVLQRLDPPATDMSTVAMQVAMKPPMAVTNAVSWRSEGIKHKKNEVFLDVVESVNLLVNSNGTVVLSEVVGCLKMRTFLSGMPECKLGLNDKVHKALALKVAALCCCLDVRRRSHAEPVAGAAAADIAIERVADSPIGS